jgi:small subunit ribosomal protein S9
LQGSALFSTDSGDKVTVVSRAGLKEALEASEPAFDTTFQATSPFSPTNLGVIPDPPHLPEFAKLSTEPVGEHYTKIEKAMSYKEHKAKISADGTSYGRGTRKAASAQVWIKPGSGNAIVNNMPHHEYFTSWEGRGCLTEPFETTKTLGQFDVYAKVKGGGITGQGEAVRLGLARALVKYQPDHYHNLMKAMLLVKDIRTVERKKPGKKKARKSAQWVKR